MSTSPSKRRRQNFESENASNLETERMRLVKLIDSGEVSKNTLEEILVQLLKSTNEAVPIVSRELQN